MRGRPPASAAPSTAVVTLRFPEPGAPWLLDDTYASPGAAIDSILAPLRRPPVGTLVRVRGVGGSLEWLGVFDGSTSVEAPRVPAGAPGGARSWLAVWEEDGPPTRALERARWIASACTAVQRGHLARAAAEAVRAAMVAVPERYAVIDGALDGIGDWAVGRLATPTLRVLGAQAGAFSSADGGDVVGGYMASAAMRATMVAVSAARQPEPSWPAGPDGSRVASSVFAEMFVAASILGVQRIAEVRQAEGRSRVPRDSVDEKAFARSLIVRALAAFRRELPLWRFLLDGALFSIAPKARRGRR